MTALTQLIINTKGKATTMTQSRDPLGRFVKGAEVTKNHNSVSAARDIQGKAVGVVIVQHAYDHSTNRQSVSSVNRETGKGNFTTYRNDGLPNNLSDPVEYHINL